MRRAGARSAVLMLQDSIVARSAVQPRLLSLAGRLELAAAQLPRPAAVVSSAAADGPPAAHAAAAVATGLDSDEDEPRATDALADDMSAGEADGGDDEEEEEDSMTSVVSEDDSDSHGSRDADQNTSEDAR